MTHESATRICTALLAWSLVDAAPLGQSAAPRADQSYSTATTAILVDVVVRDRNGRPMLDLSAADFELAEDGLRQRVDTFTRVSRGGGIGVGVAWKTPGTTTAVTPTDSASQPADRTPEDGEATTALVFDHLSAGSLHLAQKATLDYLPMNGESAVRLGVFATDPGIRTLQRYTTDRALVRRAVAGLQPSGSTTEEENGERMAELLARRRELDEQTQALTRAAAGISGAALSRSGSEVGERQTERRLVQTELNMLRSFENLDRDHQGYDTAAALLSVVRSLADLPGRKTIVFFSDGLPVSPVLSAKLDAVIETANRAHVTTYAVDAKGLRTRSSSENILKEMRGFVDERESQLTSGTDYSNQPLTMGFERVEDTLRLDSRTGLARLAGETGGFLIEHTNNLAGAFRRIDEDNRFHYLLTYTPANPSFDGKFRAISVKVRRPGAQVFARKGYRAIRATPPPAAAGYESPALALLDRTPLPQSFPVHAAAFSFPDPRRPGLTPIVVQVGTSALRFDVDRQRATYAGHATVVVRIRDGGGRTIEKLVQEYMLTGDAKDVDAAKNGDIIFYREPQLPAGVYTVESIVYDGNAHQASARIATLTVPPPDAATAMSSLILVNRAEEVNETPTVGAPLYVGRTLLYPNLGEPIRKATTSELPFYFTVWGPSDQLSAVAQLLRHGQIVAEAPVVLAAFTGARLQHVGSLPIAALATGTYELRIRVDKGGREAVARSAFFTIE